MAKDKSTKSDAPTSRFKKPSEAPAGGDSWKLESDDNDGKLFLITPLRKETVKTEKYGEKEVIVCDIVEINRKKPEKSEEHEGVYAWAAWVQGSLRAYIGTDQILGVLDKVKDDSSGKGYHWELADADDDDTAAAEAYFDSLNPLKAKAKSKPVADPKADKKAKKKK